MPESSLFHSHIIVLSRYGPEVGDEYEPYARPESHMGFINQGDPMDEYAVDEYGRPITPYGQPMMDPYGLYPNEEDDDPYMYGYGGPR